MIDTLLKMNNSNVELLRQTIKSIVGPFSISNIQEQLPTIGRDMIKLVLADLKAEGSIVLQGKGRGAKWEQIERSSLSVL